MRLEHVHVFLALLLGAAPVLAHEGHPLTTTETRNQLVRTEEALAARDQPRAAELLASLASRLAAATFDGAAGLRQQVNALALTVVRAPARETIDELHGLVAQLDSLRPAAQPLASIKHNSAYNSGWNAGYHQGRHDGQWGHYNNHHHSGNHDYDRGWHDGYERGWQEGHHHH